MCDILRAMMNLNEYLAKHAAGRTQGAIAKEIGISRSYLAEILSGAKVPGRNAITKIERATGGAVPASIWFENTGAAA